MEPSLQESVLSGRKRAIEELVRGHGYAKELEDIFASCGKTRDNPELTRDLVEKVLSSFNNGLSALSHDVEFEEVSQVEVARPVKRGKPNCSEGSEGSVRSSLATPKDRRGCYKRRCDGETWMELTASMNADHHKWRKYGQKSILRAAYPRNYFRCTHKIDQGCLATKQVQQISDDPVKFRTVYQGHHTCTDNRQLKSPEIVDFDENGSNNLGNGNSSFYLSFEGNNTTGAPVKKEETSEGFFGNKGTAVPSASSDNNYLGIFGPGGDISALSSDPGDVMSSGHHGSFMDMVMGWDDPNPINNLYYM